MRKLENQDGIGYNAHNTPMDGGTELIEFRKLNKFDVRILLIETSAVKAIERVHIPEQRIRDMEDEG